MDYELDAAAAAEAQALMERAEYLDRLRKAGDKMAADLSKDLGLDATFELKPALIQLGQDAARRMNKLGEATG